MRIKHLGSHVQHKFRLVARPGELHTKPMMDAALVRGILKSFIDGNPEDFSAAERQMAVRWFEERIVMTSKNKGSRPQHQPRMEAAANAAKQAVASYEKGDLFNAKQYAMEALKNF